MKTIFTSSLFDAQHERDNVKKKSASLLLVFLGKTFDRMPLCVRQMAVPESLRVTVAQFN